MMPNRCSLSPGAEMEKNMLLSEEDVQNLLKMITVTRDDEIDCDSCLRGMNAFVEDQVAGKPVAEARLAIERHLTTCAECKEEYETFSLQSAGWVAGKQVAPGQT